MMVSQGTPQSDSSLREVATRFLISLSLEERQEAEQEVHKVVRWYGEERPLAELSAPEIANYAEQITSSNIEPSKKLKAVKSFLAYAHKQGLTQTNLAVHLKVKKPASRSSRSLRHHSRAPVMLTAQGYADLEAELDALKSERPRVAEELQKAAADKDFRENAPLEAAREYQAHLEGRISELESTLKAASISEENRIATHKVIIGDKVVLHDLASGEQIHYTLVDPKEVDLSKGKISVASPTGQALLGQQEGDVVEVKAPVGILSYRIESVNH